jgi:UDPglucose 6-dehydrogenase
MGDGGGCHPRDNIAMSWLAKKLDLSHDFFEDIMFAREDQTEWLAKICMEHNLPIVILGKAFKPETNIQTGSPSLLLYSMLKNEYNADVKIFDPISDGEEYFNTQISKEIDKSKPYLYFIGTQHNCFKEFSYNANSIIIDPFRYMEINNYLELNSIKIIPIGGK